MILSDLTFWQNLGAFGVGFIAWVVGILVAMGVFNVGGILLKKLPLVNKILGWIFLVVIGLLVIGGLWATGLKVLYGI